MLIRVAPWSSGNIIYIHRWHDDDILHKPKSISEYGILLYSIKGEKVEQILPNPSQTSSNSSPSNNHYSWCQDLSVKGLFLKLAPLSSQFIPNWTDVCCQPESVKDNNEISGYWDNGWLKYWNNKLLGYWTISILIFWVI